MDPLVKDAIFQVVKTEPFALRMGLELVALDDDYSVVEMTYDPALMDNIYRRAHGGAVFALIDEAFETAGQTRGTILVALNVSVTYVASPEPGARLKAEARAISSTKKTTAYDIRVTEDGGRLIATCHALGYRTDKPLSFMAAGQKDGEK